MPPAAVDGDASSDDDDDDDDGNNKKSNDAIPPALNPFDAIPYPGQPIAPR